ncbi:MAG: DUF1206 domain-containing protein [Novipirellula sp. JB048]
MSSTTTAPNSWHGFKTASLPDVPKWVAGIGRFGHIAKGVVYAIMGFLAFKVAIGSGNDIDGSRGAIREIGQQPYGRFLLAVVALGLLSYTAWRWVQAGMDTDAAGSDPKGIIKRIGYALSGLSYLLLGLFAGSLAVGALSGAGEASPTQSSSPLLATTWGQVLLGIAGTIVIAVGCYFIYKGYQAKFMEKYDLMSMSERFREAALHAGRLGLITRGVAVIIVGGFLCSSAVSGTADGEISGMSDALAAIAAQSFGKVLLGITGCGLMCYAAHMMLLGWFRRFKVSRESPEM